VASKRRGEGATVILTLDHRRRQHICLVGASICGSGTALRAAESLGAQHVLGIEIEKEFAEGVGAQFGH